MKKQNIINLIKYHTEHNDTAFNNEVRTIAEDFDEMGDKGLSEYLLNLISTTGYYRPQNQYGSLKYLSKIEPENVPLYLPESIKSDLLGIVNSCSHRLKISKVLFYGRPGTGKTQGAYQIARLLEREVLFVNMETIIDSRLGQTAKNLVELFDEIRHLNSYRVVIVFDELDALVLNRTSPNDMREMARVTSTFLKELENLSDDILLIATTNLLDQFDSAMLRRFDCKISFDRYTREDLMEVSKSILQSFYKQYDEYKPNIRLFEKILKNAKEIPLPGDMKQMLKVSLAFSDSSEYDYLRRFYYELNHKKPELMELVRQGYTTREIEALTDIPRSSVSRMQRGSVNE